jgi:hypothetical protein
MTARLEALRALKAKVEAGEWDFRADAPARQVFPYQSSITDDLGLTARAAFEGSLDAAKALHEAVLPGWGWNAGVYGARVWPYPDEMARKPGVIQVEDREISPARAWLLAILSALIALEEAKQ